MIIDDGEDETNIYVFPKVSEENKEEIEKVLDLAREYAGCSHRRFKVDIKKNTVECGVCKEELSPMWVLTEIARKESRLHMNAQRLRDEDNALKSRRRFRCGQCNATNDITKPLSYRARKEEN